MIIQSYLCQSTESRVGRCGLRRTYKWKRSPYSGFRVSCKNFQATDHRTIIYFSDKFYNIIKHIYNQTILGLVLTPISKEFFDLFEIFILSVCKPI